MCVGRPVASYRDIVLVVTIACPRDRATLLRGWGVAYFVPDEETLDRGGLVALQRKRLAAMLREVRATNPFYQAKFKGISFDAAVDPLDGVPFTTRDELQADQADHPPYGTNLTYAKNRYVRLHQTSGTKNADARRTTSKDKHQENGTTKSTVPLRWLDTPESWSWFKKCWGIIYSGAGVTASDRIFFPFSFGPFVGFWAAFEAATELGNFCLPAGGMTTSARLEHLLANEATVVCCTPTYALRMLEVAREQGVDLGASSVRVLIVAGEPGGSIPATRSRIEQGFGARVFDHTGMTEIGSCSFECSDAPGGVHVIESEYVPEVIDPDTGEAVEDGKIGELVLTNLGRWGSPLIRYRTRDLVRMIRTRCACGRSFARLDGGILGRTDDMMVIRGNNVFPSTVEGLLYAFPEITEFRIYSNRDGALADLCIDVEPIAGVATSDLTDRISERFRDRLHFKPRVTLVEPGTLPRFEMKARRVVVQPNSS